MSLLVTSNLGDYDNPIPDPGIDYRVCGQYVTATIKTLKGNTSKNKNKSIGIQKTPNGKFQANCDGKYLGTFDSEEEANSQYLKHKVPEFDEGVIYYVNNKRTLTKCCLLCKTFVKDKSKLAIKFANEQGVKQQNDVCRRHNAKEFIKDLEKIYSKKNRKKKENFEIVNCEGKTTLNTRCTQRATKTIILSNGEKRYCCYLHNDLKYFTYKSIDDLSEKKKYKCPNNKCELIFNDKSSLKRHITNKHQENQEQLLNDFEMKYKKLSLEDIEDFDVNNLENDPGYEKRKDKTFYIFRDNIRYWDKKENRWKCKHKKRDCECSKCASSLSRCEKHDKIKCEECKDIPRKIPYDRSYATSSDAANWHPTKNDKKPKDYLKGSDFYAWFLCNTCTDATGIEHDYYKQLKHNSGCPYCAHKKLCKNDECNICKEKSFESCPLAKDWAFDKNKDDNGNQIKPRQEFKNSSKSFVFKCDDCFKETGIQHYYKAVLSNKSKQKSGCPYCNGNKLCDDINCTKCNEKSFASHPLSKYWAFDKNLDNQGNPILPRDVTKYSNNKYSFSCDKCYQETGIKHWTLKSLNMLSYCNSRKAQSICSYCNGNHLCGNKECEKCTNNSFASHFRSKYIDPTKSNIDPFLIRKKTHTDLDFVCEKGHTFKLSPHAIVRVNQWCPFCKPITKAIRWLRYRTIKDNIYIQHKFSEEQKEFYTGKYYLDGFAIEGGNTKESFKQLKESGGQKIDYEFHGDYWHGNPDIYDSNEINKVNKKTFGELFKKTKERENELKRSGYKVIVIWEREFNYMEKMANVIKDYLLIFNKKKKLKNQMANVIIRCWLRHKSKTEFKNN